MEDIKNELENSEKVVKKSKDKKEAKTKKNEQEVSWFIRILKEEHRFETYLGGFLACLSLGVGTLILTSVLTFDSSVEILYEYSDVIGWIFIVFGVIAMLLFIIPVFKPTRYEVKKLTLPTKKLFGGNVIRVFTFIIIMSAFFLLYESVISAILGKIV